jgi:Zn-dependent protease
MLHDLVNSQVAIPPNSARIRVLVKELSTKTGTAAHVATQHFFCYLWPNVTPVIQQIAIWALPVLAAVILHEIAHGVVANWLGDPTAKEHGRLTLNPLPHIDPFGTIGLPLMLIVMHAPFLFGYARPVPVDYRRLRHPKRDMIFVAAAGPVTNLILATLSAVAFRRLLHLELPADGAATPMLVALLSPLAMMFERSVVVNVVLAVFNLMPILPLDGGRVLTGLLPLRQAIAFSRLERYGMLIVLMLMATNVLGQVVGPVVDVFLRILL